jgi:GNAT superfamily N-acetyltransferase
VIEDVVGRAEQASQEAQREVVRRSGGRVSDSDGICLIHGTNPSWVLANGAFRTDPNLAPAEAIERVKRSFRELDRQPVLMTFERPDADLEAALAAAGWKQVIELPVMVRRSALTDEPAPPARLRWLDADDTADLEALRDVLRRGFAEDEDEVEMVNDLLKEPESIRPPGIAAVIATIDGAPVASAVVFLVREVAVLGWVATVPESRRRGLGRLVTAAATNRGLDDGAAWVTLQASPMGLPLYRSMGFETVTSSRIWLAPAAA